MLGQQARVHVDVVLESYQRCRNNANENPVPPERLAYNLDTFLAILNGSPAS